MNADGSNPTRLTFNGVYDGGPTFTSDGRRIAFHSHRNGNWDIFIADDLPLVTPVAPASWGEIKAEGMQRARSGR